MGNGNSVSRILLASGIIWAMYTLVAHTGSQYPGFGGLLAWLSLSIPFFVLGWTCRIWPRATGALLLLSAILFFRFFGLEDSPGVDPMAQGRILHILFYTGPLAGSGVILLAEGKDPGRRRRR